MTLPKVSPETLAWVRKNCPSICVYGDSSQGKTQLAGTLFQRPEYWPVRYIDGDDGASTIAAFADDPKICQFRNYSEHRKPGQDDFRWFLRELDDAKTADCGSIIIEGFSRHYNAEVARRLIADPDPKPNAQRKLYIPGANRAMAMIGAGQEVKRYRKQHGTGVPVFYSCNVKETTFRTDNGEEHKRLMPAISPNKARMWMEGCDVFVQIERGRHGIRLLGDLDDYNMFRKVRNDALLTLLRTTKNPTLPWLIDEWFKAEETQRQQARPVIEQLLAQLQQTPAPQTEETTP